MADGRLYNNLEEALKTPAEVKRLKLRNLDSLPASIGLLINLEELDLSKTNSLIFPKKLGTLKN